MLPAFFNGKVWLADCPSGDWRQTVCKDQLQANKLCTIHINLHNNIMKTSQPKGSKALDVDLNWITSRARTQEIHYMNTDRHVMPSISLNKGGQFCHVEKAGSNCLLQLLTCRSLGAWTLAVPDLALRATLWITRLGPGLSTSISTRALNSSGGPNSPASHDTAVSSITNVKTLVQICSQIHKQKCSQRVLD